MREEVCLEIEENEIKINDDMKDHLKLVFSGSRINLLLGAGFSAHFLGLLDNNENAFECIKALNYTDANNNAKKQIFNSYLYWIFFRNCIHPISKDITSNANFDSLRNFGKIFYKILRERSNPVIERQLNIFTTNYDPILEIIFDSNRDFIYNDGFEGRIYPYFSTDHFSKSYYRQAIYSNKKTEVPSVNILKIHGSLTWCKNSDDNIIYSNYKDKIENFYNEHSSLFSIDTIQENIEEMLKNGDRLCTELGNYIESDSMDTMISDLNKYEAMMEDYKETFLIVNPTKEKFSSTLLDKNYHELLRIYSNELEKENSILLVNGFSFRDEHILEITRRSLINPSLKVIIFCYNRSSLDSIKSLFENSKNENISYVYLKEPQNLDLNRLNEILNCIFNK
ncbi:hypothetical protein MmiHf6_03510 [Methanimicrococcus hongohii]|uniref:SIR2-like domain-containing protein n=1 Tax=Methanimicrococcus hongohii TaxID=3028295 RepID=A0AA96UYQ5_9EURY|nr:SIR2 family protein [Methanimicrococcus sp. Hf6]WNY23054.1 hypothetical protein MmiHf6_03510 [Methanimicrococcus sp. Hf6]